MRRAGELPPGGRGVRPGGLGLQLALGVEPVLHVGPVGPAALGPPKALITVFLGAVLGAVVFVGIVIPISTLRRARTGRVAGSEQTELAQLAA